MAAQISGKNIAVFLHPAREFFAGGIISAVERAGKLYGCGQRDFLIFFIDKFAFAFAELINRDGDFYVRIRFFIFLIVS